MNQVCCFSLIDLLVSFLLNDVEEFFLSVADVLKKAYTFLYVSRNSLRKDAQRIKFVVFLFLIFFLSLA